MAKVTQNSVATRPPGYITGRPTKYTPEMAQLCKDYFTTGYKERGDVWPTKAGFAVSLGITKETLIQWSKDEDKPEFSFAWKLFGETQEQNLVQGALTGQFNASFSIFTAKNVLGWRDRFDDEAKQSQIINVGVVILPSEGAQVALPSVKTDAIDV